MKIHQLVCAAFLVSVCVHPADARAQQSVRSSPAPASTTHPHELSGFLLRQNRVAIEAALGKHFAEEKRDNNVVAYGYHLRGFKQNYLIAFFDEGDSPEVHDKIIRLQLTGPESSGPTAFFGFALGDPAEKVEKLLGKPTSIRHEDDVDVDLWDYQQRNYSLEFTPGHKLYSIQIIDEPGEDQPRAAGSTEARRFAQAVLGKDLETQLAMVSGELECSMNGLFYGFHGGSARSILSNPRDGTSICLRRAASAVLALGPEMKGIDESIRIWTEHTPGTVVKFPPSSPLKQIVFDQEAGAFRVYEITFR